MNNTKAPNLREDPLEQDSVLKSSLKQKPHPDVIDQGVPRHRYPTRSRQPTTTTDDDVNVPLPLHGKNEKHRYEL